MAVAGEYLGLAPIDVGLGISREKLLEPFSNTGWHTRQSAFAPKAEVSFFQTGSSQTSRSISQARTPAPVSFDRVFAGDQNHNSKCSRAGKLPGSAPRLVELGRFRAGSRSRFDVHPGCRRSLSLGSQRSLFGFSDTWQLVINTGTTIVTFLIQNSQNRDSAAIQVKLDEMIRVSTARNSMVGIEHLTDDELHQKQMRGPRASREGRRGNGREDRQGSAARRGTGCRIGERARAPARQIPPGAMRSIESILVIEKEEQREIAPHHRAFHAIVWFFGTTYFFAAQCVAIVTWAIINTVPSWHAWTIDPYPFSSCRHACRWKQCFSLPASSFAKWDKPQIRTA